MQSLPRKAQKFLFGAYLAGIASLVAVFLLPPPADLRASLWEYAAFFLAGAALGWRAVHVLPGRQKADSSSISLGFVIIFAALLRFGPMGAALTGAVVALATSIKEKHLWYQTLFNIAVHLVQGVVAGTVLLLLNGWQVGIHLSESLPALVAAAILSFCINSGAVALIISLCSGRNAFRFWHDNFLWTAPGYFAGAAVSVLAIGLFGGQIPITVLCLAPVLYMTHRSFRIYHERNQALTASQKQLTDLYQATTKSLALAIEAKDRYTHQHILRVQRYALGIARQMGIKGGDLQAIEFGALLHDIGKMGISEAVLLKPGRLTAEEFAEIKQHPRIGAEILEPVPFPWPVLPVVKYHHERWDGSGYPEGLRGEDIPLSARILAVADVYDALTSDRSYRGAWSHARACSEIAVQSGKQFDPKVVEAFQAVIDTLVDPEQLPTPIVPAEESTSPVSLPSLSRPAMARNDEKPLPMVTGDMVKPVFIARTGTLVPQAVSSGIAH